MNTSRFKKVGLRVSFSSGVIEKTVFVPPSKKIMLKEMIKELELFVDFIKEKI